MNDNAGNRGDFILKQTMSADQDRDEWRAGPVITAATGLLLLACCALSSLLYYGLPFVAAGGALTGIDGLLDNPQIIGAGTAVVMVVMAGMLVGLRRRHRRRRSGCCEDPSTTDRNQQSERTQQSLPPAGAAKIGARRGKKEQKAFESTGDEDNTEAGPRPSRRGLRFRRDEKGLWAPRPGGMNGMTVAPGPGIPGDAVITAADLAERFVELSTSGSQDVNTTNGKAQFSINVTECASLTDAQRHRVSHNLEHRLDGSAFTATVSARRSVLRSWSSRLHLLHNLVPPDRSVRGSTIAPVLITSRD